MVAFQTVVLRDARGRILPGEGEALRMLGVARGRTGGSKRGVPRPTAWRADGRRSIVAKAEARERARKRFMTRVRLTAAEVLAVVAGLPIQPSAAARRVLARMNALARELAREVDLDALARELDAAEAAGSDKDPAPETPPWEPLARELARAGENLIGRE